VLRRGAEAPSEAERGDVNAARELREWREREEQSALHHPEAWMGLLTREERKQLQVWIKDAVARADRELARQAKELDSAREPT